MAPNSCVGLFFERLSRRKFISTSKLAQSNLDRCLSIVDLTALGIGSTLGLGIYVLAGQVAKEESGPSVVLSFLVAAVASVFAGLCYAEFGSRVPRAGSAYVYSYVTVGELLAFIIGWNLILEYVIGAASVARGYSGYLDSLIDKSMTESFRNFIPMNLPGLSPYPDFFAFGMTLILAVVLSVGVKESTKVNNVLTCLNLLIVIFVVVCGLFKANIDNWKIPKSEIPKDVHHGGEGGFFPFGFSGMMAGAATCFYGFVGFDCVATTGEEARNPQRAIPISIVLSLIVIFLAYFGVSAVVTLMVPYYYQDKDAAIPMAFLRVGWPVARWIVSIGALAGLSTSLLGAMFPLPRVLYAMSNDGLIFRGLSRINPRFKTPVIATMVSGVFAALMAMLFELTALVDMMSIGTLLAYTLVALSVMILRYRPDVNEKCINEDISETLPPNASSELTKAKGSFVTFLRQLVNADRYTSPTELSSSIATYGTLAVVIFLVGFNTMVIFAPNYLTSFEPWAISLLSAFVILTIISAVFIGLQPPSNKAVNFKVPWVPFIPTLSCLVNTHLMLKLSHATWLRFGVWMVIGLAIYFLYGMWQSTEEYKRRGLLPPVYNPEVVETTSESVVASGPAASAVTNAGLAPVSGSVRKGSINTIDSNERPKELSDKSSKTNSKNSDVSRTSSPPPYSEVVEEKDNNGHIMAMTDLSSDVRNSDADQVVQAKTEDS